MTRGGGIDPHELNKPPPKYLNQIMVHPLNHQPDFNTTLVIMITLPDYFLLLPAQNRVSILIPSVYILISTH